LHVVNVYFILNYLPSRIRNLEVSPSRKQ